MITPNTYVVDKSWHSFGWYSLTEYQFNYIRDILPEGSTILEIGSGFVSGELAKYYHVYSIEDDEKWLYLCHNVEYIHAELVPACENRWYNLNKNIIDNINYDLLLIDGPVDHKDRIGILHNVDMFSKNAIIFIDDTDVGSNMQIANVFRDYTGRKLLIKDAKQGIKTFGVIL